VVAAELALAVEEMGRIEDGKERWQRLQEIARELSRLRRGDYQGKRFSWEKEVRFCELDAKRDEWMRQEIKAKERQRDFLEFVARAQHREKGPDGGAGKE
jgi:hypothetical protein